MTNTINYVVDTSVFIKHFIPDPLSRIVDLLLSDVDNSQNKFFVPDLFYIECTNTLWKYVRAGRYPADKIATDLATLKGLSLSVVSTADLMEDAATIAITYGISAYDASYVALSQQVNATLLTLDQRLVRSSSCDILQCLFVQ